MPPSANRKAVWFLLLAATILSATMTASWVTPADASASGAVSGVGPSTATHRRRRTLLQAEPPTCDPWYDGVVLDNFCTEEIAVAWARPFTDSETGESKWICEGFVYAEPGVRGWSIAGVHTNPTTYLAAINTSSMAGISLSSGPGGAEDASVIQGPAKQLCVYNSFTHSGFRMQLTVDGDTVLRDDFNMHNADKGPQGVTCQSLPGAMVEFRPAGACRVAACAP